MLISDICSGVKFIFSSFWLLCVCLPELLRSNACIDVNVCRYWVGVWTFSEIYNTMCASGVTYYAWNGLFIVLAFETIRIGRDLVLGLGEKILNLGWGATDR